MASPVIPVDGCVDPAVDADRVGDVKSRLITEPDAEGLAEMFRLLGDPGRVRILFALLESGELCVCDLAATVESTESAVSQALRLLRSAGVVRRRRDGRRVHYRLSDGHVRMLLDLSAEHLRHGED